MGAGELAPSSSWTAVVEWRVILQILPGLSFSESPAKNRSICGILQRRLRQPRSTQRDNEPMLVIPDKYGIRLEDDFYMSPEGAVYFSQPSPSIDQPCV